MVSDHILAIVIAIGIQFGGFVFQLESGILPDVDRPPGVEAYLAHVTQPLSMPVVGDPEIDVEKMKKMVQAMKKQRAKATITSEETKGE